MGFIVEFIIFLIIFFIPGWTLWLYPIIGDRLDDDTISMLIFPGIFSLGTCFLAPFVTFNMIKEIFFDKRL